MSPHTESLGLEIKDESVIIDPNGLRYEKLSNGFIHLGEVATQLLGQTYDQAVCYAQGSHEQPRLGHNLMFSGLDDTEKITDVGIHPDDVSKFWQRVLAWQTYENIQKQQGQDHPEDAKTRRILHGYLSRVGAFEITQN